MRLRALAAHGGICIFGVAMVTHKCAPHACTQATDQPLWRYVDLAGTVQAR